MQSPPTKQQNSKKQQLQWVYNLKSNNNNNNNSNNNNKALNRNGPQILLFQTDFQLDQIASPSSSVAVAWSIFHSMEDLWGQESKWPNLHFMAQFNGGDPY